MTVLLGGSRGLIGRLMAFLPRRTSETRRWLAELVGALVFGGVGMVQLLYFDGLSWPLELFMVAPVVLGGGTIIFLRTRG